MKIRLARVAVILAISTLLLSSAVLAGPAQGDPPDNSGVCAIVKTLPLPDFVKNWILGEGEHEVDARGRMSPSYQSKYSVSLPSKF